MNYNEYIRKQVSKEDWVILEKLGIVKNTKLVSDIWLDYVNFEKRRMTEVPFLLQQLTEFNDPRIFDACLGSGTTTLGLKLEGIEDILSNEFDPSLLSIAKKEAIRLGQKLDITVYDWRDIPCDKYQNEFDAVLCLGNSLTYLFKQEDQLRALSNFRKILKKDGKLIIDERNFSYSFHRLSEESISSTKINYCGTDKTNMILVYASDTMNVYDFKHKDSGRKFTLVVYPFKDGELKGLLHEVGFKDIMSFGDYKERFGPKEPEFITYVARKSESKP